MMSESEAKYFGMYTVRIHPAESFLTEFKPMAPVYFYLDLDRGITYTTKKKHGINQPIKQHHFIIDSASLLGHVPESILGGVNQQF